MSKNITKITLSEEDKLYLQSLSKTRTIQAQVVDRARIILFKADGKTDKFISEGLGIGLSTVRRCIAKYIDGGAGCALFDDERSGRPVEITDDAKAWIGRTAQAYTAACRRSGLSEIKNCDKALAAEVS